MEDIRAKAKRLYILRETPEVGGGFKTTDNESQSKKSNGIREGLRDSSERGTKRKKPKTLVNKGITAFANKKVTS